MTVLLSVALSLVAVMVAVGVAWLVIARPLDQRIAVLERRAATPRDAQPTRRTGAGPIAAPPAAPRASETLAERPRAAAAVPADWLPGIPAAPPARLPDAPAPPRDAPAPSAALPDAPSPVAEAGAPTRADRIAAVRDRVARYRDLLAQRAKPRQLQDLIDEDGAARAVAFDADRQTLSLVPLDPNDPGQMLVALAAADEGTFVVLPTFEYLESFRVAFSAPAQNPPAVRHLFDLEQDDADGLRLLDPALVRIEDAGTVLKQRSGRMGGYSSGF